MRNRPEGFVDTTLKYMTEIFNMKNYNPYCPKGLTYDEWFALGEEEWLKSTETKNDSN